MLHLFDDYIEKKKKARAVRGTWGECDTVGIPVGRVGLILCDEGIGDLLEPVDRTEQSYCGSTEHCET